MKKIAIFASGSGSNAEKIQNYIQEKHPSFTIDCIVVNNSKAGIIERSKDWNCDIIHLNKSDFYENPSISSELKARKIDLIVLAGFLWLIPKHLLSEFPERIVNIHPALLPNYGGKGMYGMNVHKAVFAAKEQTSGITIHTIDAEYDKGQVLFKKAIDITAYKSAEEIAYAVLKVEHEFFAPTIDKYLSQL